MNNLFKVVEIKNVVLTYQGSYENLIEKGFKEVNDLLKNHLYKKFYVGDIYAGVICVDNNIITLTIDNANAKELVGIDNNSVDDPIKLILLLKDIFNAEELELKLIIFK